MWVQNKKKFLTTLSLVALVFLLQFFQLSAKIESERDKATEKFLNNVVHLNVLFSNGTNESGFGFVVGEKVGEKEGFLYEKERLLYIVTANHVVRKDEVDVQAETILAKFRTDMGDPKQAKLLDVNYGGIDLALLEIRKPSKDYQWEKNYFAPPDKGDTVWFIGRNQEWWVPVDKEEGQIADTPIESTFTVRISSVQPGTSGAPLISAKGIIGMIISDDLTGTANALDIEIIKEIVQTVWNYPWGLNLKEAQASEPKKKSKPINISEKSLDFFKKIQKK